MLSIICIVQLLNVTLGLCHDYAQHDKRTIVFILSEAKDLYIPLNTFISKKKVNGNVTICH